MNTSHSSLSISKNLTNPPQKDLNGTPEDMFKTSNPKIFPSLHPLSALYRQKIPNSDLSESKKIEDASKKLRCENGSQKVLPPVQNTTPIKVSIKQEKKKKISPNPIKNVPFSIPNLPTRFNPMDMAQFQEQNVSEEFVKIPQLFEPCSEPLLIPDNMGSIINRSIFLQNNFENDIETPNQALIAKAPLFTKHIHDHGIFDMAVKNPMINKYCESLRLEYFSIQAKKNVLEMQQERIVQTLKSILSSEATLQKNDSLETACSLKEEEVKQEFFL